MSWYHFIFRDNRTGARQADIGRRIKRHWQVESLETRRLLAVVGDSNLDGIFDSSDLVMAFQAGKYETGESASMSDGDWDGDGYFSSTDIVYAFQSGGYELPSTSSNTTSIELQDGASQISGTGAVVNANVVTISTGGRYELSGKLTDGRIIVDTQDDQIVTLVLNGVEITSLSNSAITVVNADEVTIELAADTDNYVTDGQVYPSSDEDAPNAAIFSDDDLTITGTGSLTVIGRYQDGIASQDDLNIESGQVIVTAVDDTIRGRDSVDIRGGTLTLNAGGDAIKTTNDVDTDEGNISITGGTLTVSAGDDGVQAVGDLVVSDASVTILTATEGLEAPQIAIESAEVRITAADDGITAASSDGLSSTLQVKNSVVTIVAGADGLEAELSLTIDSGEFSIISGGGSTQSVSDDDSAKAIKADGTVIIRGGSFAIDAAEDGIHANDTIVIDAGEMVISAGDDGIHADNAVTINGGNIVVDKSYEGVESTNIIIGGGTLHIRSSDDGINAAGGVDGSGGEPTQPGGGRPGGGATTGTGVLTITGGYIFVSADGDGVDVNGSATMSGGTLIVNGPTRNDNGALDYDGTFVVTGGLIIAAGSAGMAQAPSTTSTQASLSLRFSTTQTAGTMIHIVSSSGTEIATFVPTKSFQSIVVSAPSLIGGTTYLVYSGGSSTGTETDGLFVGGVYTAGTLIGQVIVN
ncbi:MAG: carbohydrate-binding domain-containing protein [Planctomycetales bacterium]|nr:carbohydrate-binding domain-containing protein [Planctomycetales bacterium]